MKRVIFTKYSNDRNTDYNIRTDIMEDENGNRFVYKSGVSDGGKRHIKNMYEASASLQKLFSDSIFEINKCEQEDESLLLEYVSGKTLESILDGYLESKNHDAFAMLIKKYAQEMKKIAKEKFVPCEEYYRVFGPSAVDAVDCGAIMPCDIDMIFPNINIVDERWIVLDYEWVFNFPVPVDFVLFRSIYYYLPNREKLLEGIDLYELVGINNKIYDVYKKMEDEFQKHVFEGNVPLWELYEQFGKNFHIAVIEGRNMECVKYYEDHFISEYINVLPDPEGKAVLYIDVDENVRTLAIDPASCNCIVSVDKAKGIAEEEYDILYSNNGVSMDNKTICFNHDDPRFLFDDFRKGIRQIYFEFHISYISEGTGNRICKMIDDFNDMRCSNIAKDESIIEQAKKIDSLEQKIDSLEQEINAIRSSRSWQMTEPIRNITKK